jgi:hypothetical protein
MTVGEQSLKGVGERCRFRRYVRENEALRLAFGRLRANGGTMARTTGEQKFLGR